MPSAYWRSGADSPPAQGAAGLPRCQRDPAAKAKERQRRRVGEEGFDVVAGGGPVALEGGAGSRRLGRDRLGDGGLGSDRVDGDEGAVELETASDKLDLSAFGIDATRVRIATDGISTVLYADTDGAAPGYELAISFVGANAIVASDIVF